MPGVYADGAFDVVGSIVGIVDRAAILPDTASMRPGDALFGLPSSGPHTNGYSLIRQTVTGRDLGETLADGRTLGDALLEPHRAYVGEVDALQAAVVPLRGLAHITGGGLADNVPRVLPEHLRAEIDPDAWARPELFELLVEWAGLSEAEALRVFNMGIGMVMIVAGEAEGDVASVLPEAVRIGRLAERDAGGAQVLFG